MNILLPAILMFTRGTRFWHTAISINIYKHSHVYDCMILYGYRCNIDIQCFTVWVVIVSTVLIFWNVGGLQYGHFGWGSQAASPDLSRTMEKDWESVCENRRIPRYSKSFQSLIRFAILICLDFVSTSKLRGPGVPDTETQSKEAFNIYTQHRIWNS